MTQIDATVDHLLVAPAVLQWMREYTHIIAFRQDHVTQAAAGDSDPLTEAVTDYLSGTLEPHQADSVSVSVRGNKLYVGTQLADKADIAFSWTISQAAQTLIENASLERYRYNEEVQTLYICTTGYVTIEPSRERGKQS